MYESGASLLCVHNSLTMSLHKPATPKNGNFKDDVSFSHPSSLFFVRCPVTIVLTKYD
jgi:hypothetical protein